MNTEFDFADLLATPEVEQTNGHVSNDSIPGSGQLPEIDDVLKEKWRAYLRKPLAYQGRVLDWAYPLDRIALFMEMRLGKTLVAIRWAESKPGAKKKLVIAPLSVIKTWEQELEKEGLVGTQITRANMMLPMFTDGWYLTNYEAIRSLELFTKPELRIKWDLVICDESTKIRKTDAKRTQLTIENFENTPYKAILSGFPAPESMLDYYTQYKFLNGQFMDCYTWHDFEYRYGELKNYVVASKRNAILNYVKENSYTLKRYECGVGSKKEYTNRYVQFDEKSNGREVYDKFQMQWYYKGGGDSEYSTNFILAAQRILQQIASGTVRHPEVDFYSEHKLKELVSLLNGELHGEKVVIWCAHSGEIKMTMRKLGDKARYIAGDVNQVQRDRNLAKFQQVDSDVRYLVCQLGCADMGLDMSAADTAIYFSNSMQVEHRYQSEDRIVHPKKQVPLLYIDLLTEGTIDEDIRRALDDKPKRTGLYQEKIYTSFLERMAKKYGILPND